MSRFGLRRLYTILALNAGSSSEVRTQFAGDRDVRQSFPKGKHIAVVIGSPQMNLARILGFDLAHPLLKEHIAAVAKSESFP